MKKAKPKAAAELRAEYKRSDFGTMVRGKYAARIAAETNIASAGHDPELAAGGLGRGSHPQPGEPAANPRGETAEPVRPSASASASAISSIRHCDRLDRRGRRSR